MLGRTNVGGGGLKIVNGVEAEYYGDEVIAKNSLAYVVPSSSIRTQATDWQSYGEPRYYGRIYDDFSIVFSLQSGTKLNYRFIYEDGTFSSISTVNIDISFISNGQVTVIWIKNYGFCVCAVRDYNINYVLFRVASDGTISKVHSESTYSTDYKGFGFAGGNYDSTIVYAFENVKADSSYCCLGLDSINLETGVVTRLKTFTERYYISSYAPIKAINIKECGYIICNTSGETFIVDVNNLHSVLTNDKVIGYTASDFNNLACPQLTYVPSSRNNTTVWLYNSSTGQVENTGLYEIDLSSSQVYRSILSGNQLPAGCYIFKDGDSIIWAGANSGSPQYKIPLYKTNLLTETRELLFEASHAPSGSCVYDMEQHAKKYFVILNASVTYVTSYMMSIVTLTDKHVSVTDIGNPCVTIDSCSTILKGTVIEKE